MVDENLLSHVADIVTAHVSNNAIPANDLAGLIQTVHATLAGLGATVEAVEEKRTPAVSVRASVKPDTITCLECGAKAKMLKRHLATAHGQTPEDYRARWNLARDYPMVAPEYAARRKELALSIGLGRKPKVEAAPIPETAPPAKTPAKRKAAPAANKDVVASVAAYAWYRSQPLPSFGDATAEELVRQGQGAKVRAYLGRIAAGGFA